MNSDQQESQWEPQLLTCQRQVLQQELADGFGNEMLEHIKADMRRLAAQKLAEYIEITEEESPFGNIVLTAQIRILKRKQRYKCSSTPSTTKTAWRE